MTENSRMRGYWERPLLTAEEAMVLAEIDYQRNVAATRRWAETDGLVEVEEGHWAKPGETVELSDGRRLIVHPPNPNMSETE